MTTGISGMMRTKSKQVKIRWESREWLVNWQFPKSPTAAARGAPRHDQRKVVWGVYDETRSKHLSTPPVYVYMYYCTVLQYSKRKSARAQSLRTEPLHTQSISQSEHTHRQTDRQIFLQETFEMPVETSTFRWSIGHPVLFEIQLQSSGHVTDDIGLNWSALPRNKDVLQRRRSHPRWCSTFSINAILGVESFLCRPREARIRRLTNLTEFLK